ncbi:MAG: HNH endonuclease [Chloroflexi bacterium]|nr:HNH endonuclease [Chloroflexota bacterium]
MTPEDKAALFRVALWTIENKHKRVETIREIAGTEENYLLIIREINRVEAQVFRARALRAEATLTLVDWLRVLEAFHWQCAYCQSKPFQVMSYIVPLPEGGTTVGNCIPACYSCRRSRNRVKLHHLSR